MVGFRSGIIVGILLTASPAWPQTIDGNGIPFRHWDFDASVGLHASDAVDSGDRAGNSFVDPWSSTAAVSGGVGRYWTGHWKTEAGVVNYHRRTGFGQEPVPVPAGLGYAFYRARIQRLQLSVAGTYQFLENVFAHPYLSAGARVGFVNIDRVRETSVTIYSGRAPVGYRVPPLETRETLVQVRPFLAGGFKSYFSERAFVRSEASTGFSHRGLSQFVLRLGFGVDF
jgi:hypothetical protein